MCVSLSLSATWPTVCQSSWLDSWSHMRAERESRGQRIRGIIDRLGGVKSACSTTAMRSRGCRQMHTNHPKAQTWVKNNKKQKKQKWREVQRDKKRQSSYNAVQWILRTCWQLQLLSACVRVREWNEDLQIDSKNCIFMQFFSNYYVGYYEVAVYFQSTWVRTQPLTSVLLSFLKQREYILQKVTE